MFTHIVIHRITILNDAFFAIALWQFLVKYIADGDNDGSLGVSLIKWMIHTSKFLLDFVKQLHGHLLYLLDDHSSVAYLLVIKTLVSHSNNSAILSRVWRSGCEEFVHHLLTVVTFLPSCTANHLLVLFFSARTTFSLFKSFIFSFLYDLNANIVKFYVTIAILLYYLIILKTNLARKGNFRLPVREKDFSNWLFSFSQYPNRRRERKTEGIRQYFMGTKSVVKQFSLLGQSILYAHQNRFH